jgi:hypothetical protein
MLFFLLFVVCFHDRSLETPGVKGKGDVKVLGVRDSACEQWLWGYTRGARCGGDHMLESHEP